MVGVQLVEPALVRLERHVRDRGLPLEPRLGGRVACAQVRGAVPDPEAAHLGAQLRLERHQVHRPVEQARHALQRARVVAQLVVLEALHDRRIARQVPCGSALLARKLLSPPFSSIRGVRPDGWDLLGRDDVGELEAR